jgi:hypothetical protein
MGLFFLKLLVNGPRQTELHPIQKVVFKLNLLRTFLTVCLKCEFADSLDFLLKINRKLDSFLVFFNVYFFYFTEGKYVADFEPISFILFEQN